MWDFPLFPEQASTVAGRVDGLYYFLVGLTAFFGILISGAVVYFAIKYRRGNRVDRSRPLSESAMLEAVWIGVPLAIVLVIFYWGTSVYFTVVRPPKHAEDVYVTGKQWMWKVQHLSGQREINELHVPVGKPIKLIMTSQDVIHSFYIPAFRVKQDVLPGRYTQMWFEASKAGTYHLFCAEYCGTQHSGMVGRVIAMEPTEYEAWLRGERGNGGSAGQTMASAGQQIFDAQGCRTCHADNDPSRAPLLKGLYGKPVQLASGQTVVADEQYIRESILRSQAQIVAGYQPLMPVYQGRISEDDLQQLVAYIKSLGGADQTQAKGSTGGTGTVQSQSEGGTPTQEQARGTTARPIPGSNETSGNQ